MATLTIPIILHSSGLGDFDTKFGLIIFGNAPQALVSEKLCTCNLTATTLSARLTEDDEKTIVLSANFYLDTL